MANEVARIALLRLNVGLVDEVNALAEAVRALGHIRVGPAHVQIDIDVNAIFLQVGDQPVELIELLWIERLHIGIKNARRRLGKIKIMQADEVDAELLQTAGDPRRVLFRRHGMIVADVCAVEPHSLTATVYHALAISPQIAMSPSRLGIEMGQINGRAGRLVVSHIRDDKGEPAIAIGLLSRSQAAKKSGEKKRATGKTPVDHYAPQLKKEIETVSGRKSKQKL